MTLEATGILTDNTLSQSKLEHQSSFSPPNNMKNITVSEMRTENL